MKTTFKDKVLSLYRRTIYKYKWLKGPMMILSVILLAIDRIAYNIKSSGRKVLGICFTLTFAFISCSFSGVIFDGFDTEFVDPYEQMYLETEISDAEFAEEVVDEEVYLDVNEEIGNSEEQVDDEVVVSGVDILNEIDLSTIDESFDEEITEFSSDDWQLVLVNKQHPIPEDYSFELGDLTGGMKCDKRVISDLYSMIEAAYKDGVNLVIRSPYRDSARQNMLFDRKVNKYTSQGMSYMDAYKLAAQAVTVPGCSEHEIGLAFDITSDTYSNLNAAFGDTAAGKWLAEHSYEYGFIIRYPLGKEEITGIEYESWHFRYVGKSAAKIIVDEDLTLEEFWEKYI